MLWDASAINGYAIEASDGRFGTVSDLLFEDVGWIVRWLVVDTGNWLPGRKVLLPLSALGHLDEGLRAEVEFERVTARSSAGGRTVKSAAAPAQQPQAAIGGS